MFHRLRLALPVRLVLAWFVLALAAAAASPAFSGPLPQPGDCVQADDASHDGTPAHEHKLDCPLCVLLAAPPAQEPQPAFAAPRHAPLVRSGTTGAPARVAAQPPARGPPLAS